jgi:ribonuclease P protein component
MDGNGGLAVVVSKKAAKLAVSRHLLKRRMLAAMRLYARADRAIIAYARPGAAALSYRALEAELSELLARALESK